MLQYTITDLPAVWPGKKTTSPKRAPFKTQWTRTMDLLERELKHLGARNVQIALDLPRGAAELRSDGMLRADARPKPAVILSFIDRDGQRQAYPCDRFGWWQDNLYAIAVVLEDLRRAERYGVQSSLIRAGFKALPGSGGTTNTEQGMTARSAAEVLARYVAFHAGLILDESSVFQAAAASAKRKSHPDAGGSTEAFQEVGQACAVLERRFAGQGA